MTDKIDTNQEAREAIAKIISNSGYHQNEYTKANSILSLEGDGWKIVIEDTNDHSQFMKGYKVGKSGASISNT